MGRILVRADAGPGIGLGHLQRSLSLAQALVQCDVEPVFLMNGHPDNRSRVEGYGFKAVELKSSESWSTEDLDETAGVAAGNGCSGILVDSHLVRPSYLDGLKPHGICVIVRDDLAHFPFSADIVFNGNADAATLNYQASSSDTKFLLGPTYSVLAQEYWTARPRTGGAGLPNVLVVLGGTDPFGMMPPILESLDRVALNFRLTVVVGPYFTNGAAVEAVVQAATKPMQIVHSPESLLPLMLEADLAVSAGGQTLYELASIGCPAVAIPIAPNQRGQSQALADFGAAVSGGDATAGEINLEKLAGIVESLLADPRTLAVLGDKGRKLVDGQGALRVADRIEERLRANSACQAAGNLG
jgi:UDP-2,4-diacetamido-2,4,6-trideoxy-beta-L-altropyranose hydrolase